MRSGHVTVYDGRLKVAGLGGLDWSAVATSKRWGNVATPSAHYLELTTSVLPSAGPSVRSHGLPLRWLVKFL